MCNWQQKARFTYSDVPGSDGRVQEGCHYSYCDYASSVIIASTTCIKSFISSACHSVSSTIRQKQHLSTSYLENDSSAKSHSFFGHWSACPPLLQQRHESKHQSAGFMPIQRRSTQCMGPNRHQKLDLIHYIVNQNDERALKLDPTWIFHIKYLLQHDTIQHDTFSQLWSASCRLGGLSKNKRPKIICISSAISSTTLYNHDWRWILWILPTWPTYCKQPFVQ